MAQLKEGDKVRAPDGRTMFVRRLEDEGAFAVCVEPLKDDGLEQSCPPSLPERFAVADLEVA